MAGRKNPNILPAEQIVKMYDSGMTQSQIAGVCKCSSSRICCILKQAGAEARSRWDYPPTEAFKESSRRNGMKCKGIKRSNETRHRVSEAKKLYRKRDDYEFGGHEKVRKDGYVSVFVPGHPDATKDGFVLKHRLIMEQMIGRRLLPNEDVHHINHDPSDNRPENLTLMTHAEHASMHTKERRLQHPGKTLVSKDMEG